MNRASIVAGYMILAVLLAMPTASWAEEGTNMSNDVRNLNFGLSGLPLLSEAKSRSISAENPTGEVGGGAKETPDSNHPASKLGKGWKVRPCITLPKESTTTLAEIDGPGTITHIWITVDPKAYRDCVLRFFWDGEDTPSVEVPLGDFFANGHALRYKVNSLPVAVNPSGGFNCYWPMPFRKSCKITIENERFEDIGGFFYQISYELEEVPEHAAYFHAQWRRSVTKREKPEHVILDSVTDGVFTVDNDWRITSFNRAAERITGVPREEAVGSHCCDVFRASICESACALSETIRTAGDPQGRRRQDDRRRGDVPRPEPGGGAPQGAPFAVHLRRHRGERPGDEGALRGPPGDRRERLDGADRGCQRHGQGAVCPSDP